MTGHAALTDSTKDWACARQIQTRFMQLSPSAVDGVEYAAHCRQMDTVGGDFYQFLPLESGCLAMAVGDASGKGLPGALIVSNVQSSVRTAALFAGSNLPVTLEAVNRQVYESSLVEHYATLFYCVVDSRTRTLRYVNAGHPPALLLRRDGSVVWLESSGAPVGMFPSANYREGMVELRTGDLVLAYTDGVIEAVDPAGEEFGMDRLRKVLTNCATRDTEEIVAAVFSALDAHTRGNQTDDATIAILRAI